MSSFTGAAIRAARLARGWTQRQLAEVSGVSEIAIKRLEGGKNVPSGNSLQRLAQALEVSTDTLMGRNDQFANPVPPVPTWRQLGVSEDRIAQAAAIWADLSRDQRVKLSGHLQNSAISLAAVDALIEQVQVRVDALKAQVQEADDPPPTRDPVGPEQPMEVKGYEQSTRHGHIFSPG